MNKTSHTDEPYEGDDGYNQSPNPLSNDLTTNEDFNGTVNRRAVAAHGELQPLTGGGAGADAKAGQEVSSQDGEGNGLKSRFKVAYRSLDRRHHPAGGTQTSATVRNFPSPPGGGEGNGHEGSSPLLRKWKKNVMTLLSFVGPGFMIAVAYIDPGNYSTDIDAGASYRFRLLFIVLLSNIFAIFLQALAIKLGTVSGLNLAEACRAWLPRWLNYILYAFAEVAIMATDIAEVIGFAIALNILIPKIPLVAGCAISIIDVMFLLLFYRPHGSMKNLRYFEIFVMFLVLAVVVCFCIQMSMIRGATVGEVFQGYLPSKYLVEQEALYQACGILGATVMPHSLYLGSGIVQPRLREYDQQTSQLPPEMEDQTQEIDQGIDKGYYVPSLGAIKHSLKVSVLELTIALFTFALFVNSAILIVAGASLYRNPDALTADIFGIHDLLSKTVSPAAGLIFALALLFSGVSAGIVCTIAGQMVSEGAINWKIRPWLRRLITRSISITPSIIIAGAVGREGLNAALNGSQVALSIVLPFVTVPLIYFTSRKKYMTVRSGRGRWLLAGDDTNDDGSSEAGVDMSNNWVTIIVGVLIWLFMAVMNVANLVLLGKS